MDADDFAARMRVALQVHDATRERSLQRELGFSDLACHEKARRKLAGAQPSDAPTRWSAQVGTAVHEVVDAAAPGMFDDAKVKLELTCKLPSGLLVTGHPDLILPPEPSCNDAKTVNGPGELARKRRHGPDEPEVMQVSLGYEAAVQNGVIPDHSGVVRVFWLDRSGASDEIAVWQERFDPAWVDRASQWLEDAAYAAEHGEEAMKDPHWSFCRKFCEWFTDCRGGTAVFGPVVDDERLISAAVDHHAAKARRAAAAAEMKAARAVLEDLRPDTPNGNMVTFQVGPQRVRFSWVNRADVTNGGYWRLEDDEMGNGDAA